MSRIVLSFFVSGLVLLAGMATAWVQSRNFASAANLDELQLESEWYMRRMSLLREELERNEFMGVDAYRDDDYRDGDYRPDAYSAEPVQ